MRTRLLTLGVLLLASCSSGDDGPVDPGADELPSIRATVQRSGRDIDDYVTVILCAGASSYSCQAQTVSPNGEATFPSLAPGSYDMFLRDVAPNCSVTGEWFQSVAVQDSNVSVGFSIQCRGPGTVRVSAVTSGTNLDATYDVSVGENCDDYYSYCNTLPLAATGSVDFLVPAGQQTFTLFGVADNCTVITPGSRAEVTAIEDEVVALRYEVACQ
jgi:hypothetical protein